MRAFASFCCTLASIVLVVAILITCVQLVVLNRDFFDQEYMKISGARATKMEQSELMRVTDHLLNYLTGDEDSLQIKAKINGETRYAFDQRESEHMVDVRDLYQNGRDFRNIGVLAVIAVVLLTLLMIRKDRLQLLAKSYVIGTIVVGVIVAALGVWIAADFDSFWNAFHMVLFTNDKWLLDPNSSLMINMFPLQFWYDVVIRILQYFAASAGGLFLVSAGYLGYRGFRRRQLLSVKENG